MQQSLEGLDQIVAPIALYPDILIAQIPMGRQSRPIQAGTRSQGWS